MIHFSINTQRLAIFCVLASLFSLTACDKRQTPAPVRHGQSQSAPTSGEIKTEVIAPGSIQTEMLDGNTGQVSQNSSQTGKKVALLVPLTGKHAALGQSLQAAAEMALFEKADEHLSLEIIDTKSTSQGAMAAAQKAVAAGAPMILGPIFGDDVKVVAPVARQSQIPVISFSNNPQIAGNGVFAIGLSPEEQIQTVVHFVQSKGSKSIVVLLPRNPFGDLMAQEVSNLKSAGMPIAQVIYYNSQDAGELQKTLNPLSTLSFDTLLIPEGGAILSSLVKAIEAQGIILTNKTICGSAQWDETETMKIKSLQGAYIASSDLSKRRPFEAQYKTTYQSTPPRIASLAYDGVSMMAILNKHFPNDPYALSALTQGRGFAGVDGVFRLKSDGRCERKLAVLQLTPSGFVNVEGGGRTF